MGNGKKPQLVDKHSVRLTAKSLWLCTQLKSYQETILKLLDMLEETRKNWQASEEQCRRLESDLHTERALRMTLEDENKNLKERLSNGCEHDESDISQHSRSRKRSIDFLTEDSDTSLPRKVRRSSSVPNQIINSAPCCRTKVARTSTFTSQGDQAKRRSLDSEDINQLVKRQHIFTSKRNFLSGIVCAQCHFSIRFATMYNKCSVCKLSYHESCSRRLEMPCLPAINTPRRDNSNLKALRLADYCPDTRPMIPHLIVHCVMHLEKTSSNAALYITPGNEEMAQQLLSSFKLSRHPPILTNYDPQTVAGCIVKFLNEVRDPLILCSSHAEFFAASREPSEEELLEVFHTLPTPNLNTLAYLCSHWKSLAENDSNENISVDSLVEVLGPVVFGTGRQSAGDSASESIEASKFAFRKMLTLPSVTLKALIRADGITCKSTPLSRTGSGSRKPVNPFQISSVAAAGTVVNPSSIKAV